METPERLENLPATPEPSSDSIDVGNSIEELRLNQLKEQKGVCVICYCNLRNGKRCFPENCLHIFHFECLRRWSEQKNQCPLCKKVFDTIVHNVRSKTEFDRQPVNVINRPEEPGSPVDISDLVTIPVLPLNFNSVFHSVNFLPINHQSPRRRFTYRTRFEATLEQNEAIQEFLGNRSESDSRLTPAAWRSSIYNRNLYALPLPDSTGRYRECSADFYRNNPAQTHRLIPWLNRELVVLLPHNQTNAIPQILEDMREMLCRFDIQSRTVRKYFQRYLHQRTDHFIHEFYNFAISAYDIVGYDRHVDYSIRNQSTSTTVEISDESEDNEVQVIEPIVAINTNNLGDSSPISMPSTTTTVVMETSGAQHENCFIADVTPQHSNPEPAYDILNENPIETNVENTEQKNPVVLGSSSSDSECEFVLALKPPHLRTPEMLSLDSASDSDVIFVPNLPEVIARVDSSTTDSDDNKPLAITKLKLKSEIDDTKTIIHEEKMDISSILEPEIQIESFNYGASTSHQSMMDQQEDPFSKVKKIYFAPKRKRISTKNVFEKSSSSSSETSSSSENSSDSSNSNQSDNHRSKMKRRKVAEKNMKRKRISSSKNQKPLSLLPSTEEAQNDDEDDEPHPRVKSVIIKIKSNQPYVMQKSSNTENSSES